MVDMVKRRLSDFDYRGKLDRQHYSFVKTAVVAPYPIYHHLIFCYNRTGRRLQARVACSLLPKWQLKRNLGRISHLSRMLSCDLSGHSRFVKSRDIFEGNIQDLLSVFLPEHTQELTEDAYLREALLKFHRQGRLSRDEYSPKLISDLKLVIKQHSLEETEKSEEEVDTNDALDAFLSDLVPKNAEVSAGSFSLNAKHASRKLQKFQLNSPQNFVVHLVGGAVAGGAKQVDIYVDSDDIVVSFDGTPMTRGELADLEESLLHSEGSPRSRELNVALNAALSLNPRWLRVETWFGGSGWKLEFGKHQEPESLDRSPFSNPDQEGHRVHFRDRLGFEVVRRFLNSRANEHPELDILKERCHLAAVPLLYQGTDLRSVPWEEAKAYLVLEDPKQPIGFEPPEDMPGLKKATESGFSLLLLLGPKPELKLRINGVLYEAPSRHGKFPLWCMLTGDDLDRDLSYTGVKDSDELAVALLELGEQEQNFRNFLVNQLTTSDASAKQVMASYLRDRLIDGDSDLRGVPIFSTLDNQFFPLSSLKQKSLILFTEKDWKYPLRSGELVFKLSAAHRKFLIKALGKDAPQMVSANTELNIHQAYFEYRESWLRRPPEEQIKVSRSYGPTSPIRGLDGQFALNRRLAPCLLEPYSLMRPLPVTEIQEFPRGLRLACNWDPLQASLRWNRVETDAEWETVLAKLRSLLDGYYETLFGHDGKYTVYLLHYLIWKKKNGEKWKHLVPRLQFRLRDGSARSWSELNSEKSQLEAFESLWLKTLHVKSEEKRLMTALLA